MLRTLKIFQLMLPFYLLTFTVMNNYMTASSSVSPNLFEGCWVFNHMPKAGSTTTLSLFRTFAGAQKQKRANVGFSPWEDDLRLSEIRDGNLTFIWGEYTKSLRAMGSYKNCKWFTLMRHPITRIVSMFLDCKYQSRGDQNCGKGAFDFDVEGADLHAFARVYRNESLRQFIMVFFRPQEIRACRAVQAVKRRFPGWFKVGLFVDELYANATNSVYEASSSVEYEAMEMFLQPAIGLIQTYAAVAKFEEFDINLQLFTNALKIPGLDWVKTFEHQGIKNVNVHVETDVKEAMVSEAWTDPVLHEILALDIVLYNHAASIFKQQLAMYEVY